MGITTWFAFFLLTVLIEGAVYVAAFGWSRRNAGQVALANLSTHPLGYALIVAGGLPFVPVEAGIVVVEALVYRRLRRASWADAFGASAVCNGVTIAVSLAF